MTDNQKKDKKDYIEKVSHYVLIAFFIAFIFFFVVYMEHSKMQYYQNQNNVNISANAHSINEISNYDTITDLTGTSWIINEHLEYFPSFDSYELFSFADDSSAVTNFELNFISNNIYFVGLTFRDSDYSSAGIMYDASNYINDVLVYNTIEWISNDYRTISFDSNAGLDATNIYLISWLQSNATQIQTGYSSTINLTNCSCNKSSETGLTGSYSATIVANNGYYLTNVSTTLGTVSYYNNNIAATILITDITEDFTISANASLIYHNISYNLGNVVVTSNKPTQIDEISSISITFQPFSNYVLPEYINVEGVTQYIWNDDTGVLTLVNAYDDVYITINAEYKSGQYTFVELIDSVTLVPVNTFFNLFNFQLLGVNIYNLLLSALILFVIIKIILKVFK